MVLWSRGGDRACSYSCSFTRLGVRIRAGTLDLETVSALGVNVRVLRNFNFGLGIYLAGLAGVLAAGMLGLQPTIGSRLIMPSFVAIIVGGLGSLPGTLLGGLLSASPRASPPYSCRRRARQ